MKNKINLKSYDIVNDERNEEIIFSLVTNNLFLFTEIFSYKNKCFYEVLEEAMNKFENIIAKDIYYSWVFKMEMERKELKFLTNSEEEIIKLRDSIDFDTEDWDTEFIKCGFRLASLFEDKPHPSVIERRKMLLGVVEEALKGSK